MLKPGNRTLLPNDELLWDTPSKQCISRRHSHTGQPEGEEPMGVVYGASGEALPKQCCRFTSLIKAEWWHHYRSGAPPPSLGEGDAWVASPC